MFLVNVFCLGYCGSELERHIKSRRIRPVGIHLYTGRIVKRVPALFE
jgi:hypothetical protein